jgi:hypothetical protein
MTSGEYTVVFPDKGTLETFSKIAYLELSIYKLKVNITKSSLNPATSSMLKTCWVQITNVPGVAWEVTMAKALDSLVGQPLVVDELSLVRNEPIRVKVNYRDPGTLNALLKFSSTKLGTMSSLWLKGILGKVRSSRVDLRVVARKMINQINMTQRTMMTLKVRRT